MKAWFTQSPLNNWCWDISVTRTLWSIYLEAGNSNELILCNRGNSGSSFPVVVLMRASFIIALDGFLTALKETFKVLDILQIDWPSCLKVRMNCHLSLLIWAVLAIIWTIWIIWTLLHIGLTSLYLPYHVTTQLIGSNTFDLFNTFWLLHDYMIVYMIVFSYFGCLHYYSTI